MVEELLQAGPAARRCAVDAPLRDGKTPLTNPNPNPYPNPNPSPNPNPNPNPNQASRSAPAPSLAGGLGVLAAGSGAIVIEGASAVLPRGVEGQQSAWRMAADGCDLTLTLTLTLALALALTLTLTLTPTLTRCDLALGQAPRHPADGRRRHGRCHGR